MNKTTLITVACGLFAVVGLLSLRATAASSFLSAPTAGLSQDFMLVPDFSVVNSNMPVSASTADTLEDWEFTLRTRNPKCRFNR